MFNKQFGDEPSPLHFRFQAAYYCPPAKGSLKTRPQNFALLQK